MKKVFGLIVVILIVVAVFLYRPQKIEEPQSTPDWTRYENPELGIAFSYPPEWGEAWLLTGAIRFPNNFDIVITTLDESSIKSCIKPKTIEVYSTDFRKGSTYCRLFENEQEEMIEAVRAGDLPGYGQPYLTQHAFVKDFEFYQSFSEIDSANIGDSKIFLQSILDRTAPADVLQKIDTFEKVMLTLEVK